ncbi:hypothetical protein BDR04DRAFT_1005396, partial [Suillus decipiens]
YHTSILFGFAWVHELLNGHPERIKNELGMWKHTIIPGNISTVANMQNFLKCS